MKKFNLPLTTAISAAILASTACHSGREWQTDANTRVCVDKSGARVADDQCRSHTGSGVSPFVWYYIARGGYVPYYNRPVTGGSYQPASSPETYTSAPATAPAGAITRGGFGSIGEGHAGGGAGE
jgi:hypothetical protein